MILYSKMKTALLIFATILGITAGAYPVLRTQVRSRALGSASGKTTGFSAANAGLEGVTFSDASLVGAGLTSTETEGDTSKAKSVAGNAGDATASGGSFTGGKAEIGIEGESNGLANTANSGGGSFTGVSTKGETTAVGGSGDDKSIGGAEVAGANFGFLQTESTSDEGNTRTNGKGQSESDAEASATGITNADVSVDGSSGVGLGTDSENLDGPVYGGVETESNAGSGGSGGKGHHGKRDSVAVAYSSGSTISGAETEGKNGEASVKGSSSGGATSEITNDVFVDGKATSKTNTVAEGDSSSKL